MKTSIKHIAITGLAVLLLSACSGESSSSKGDGVSTIPLAGINCVTSPSAADIDGYKTLQSNDTIVKDDANTTVEIYHDVDGLKKVCLVSGSAHILR